MPGFQINNEGGITTDAPTNTREVRRKHRWYFSAMGRGTTAWTQSELLMLQSAQRPSFKFEEPEMHHNQEVVYFAGKQTWEPITLTWYDSEQDPDISKGIYHWLETVAVIGGAGAADVAHPRDYKKTCTLKLIDGTGQDTEEWTMHGTWPSSVNWQELDYSATELMTCEAVMRYDRAVREATQFSGPQTINPTNPV